MLDKANHKRFFTQQKYFMKGKSAGHLLATVIQAQRGTHHISRLMRADGSEATVGVDVLATLQDFYAHLSTSKCRGNTDDLLRYLADIPTPTLSSESRQALDQLLTLEELERVLQLTPNEKAPGSDGLPAEVLKQYQDILPPPPPHTCSSSFKRWLIVVNCPYL